MAVNPFPGFVGLGDIQDEKLRSMLSQLERWARQVSVEDVEMTCEKKVGSFSLGSVATTYDNVTQSANTSALSVDAWRTATWEFAVTATDTPTSIVFTLQTSRDGDTWYDSQDADHTITVLFADMPANVSMTTEFSGGFARVSATANGTTAVHKITVAGGVKLGG